LSFDIRPSTLFARGTRPGEYGNSSLFNRNMQKTVLRAPVRIHIAVGC